MTLVSPDDPSVVGWLRGLEERHLTNLTPKEVARALRALSSCYVERRGRLAEGGALSSTGKRAAFALFYGPQHFFVTSAIVASLPGATEAIDEIIDLGCGTGAAGAAWAVTAQVRSLRGFDRHPWAVKEAGWTYRQFGLRSRVTQADISGLEGGRVQWRLGSRGTAILVAYAANELAADGRARLLATLLDGHARGSAVLVIEPIARKLMPWWDDWRAVVERAGGRADEWRFPARLPSTQASLARAAGLDPRELTARSLFLGPAT